MAAALVMALVAGISAGCARADALPARLVPATRLPAIRISVLTGTAGTVSAAVAAQLFRRAPLIVVTGDKRPAEVASAGATASRLHAPLLVATGNMRAETRRLGTRVALAVGVSSRTLSAQLPSIDIATKPATLPTVATPPPLHQVAVLVRRGDTSAAATAAAATAQASGADVIAVSGYDPMSDPAAVVALAAARPRRVIAIGSGFGPAKRLGYRLSVAMTGVQLPGGGQVIFPGRRLVALYGYPGTPSLGALGEQGIGASIARVRRLAAAYRPLSSVPVVPAFEILATVAQSRPGPDGSYSYQSPLTALRPWVRRASAAGLYVVLDLQAGRDSLLAQAKRYRPLLTRPNVGLAIDPEWKLQPGELPLRQIGSVNISEVNSVIGWLSRLTAQNHLPQKLLVLHQFRLSMIVGERRLDTRHSDLAIVIHMDGQGTPGEKVQTWNAVTGAAPRKVFFGWKNFFVKDHPMLTPRQTMARSPEPVMISYQ